MADSAICQNCYFWPNGHQREAVSPPFVLHDPPKVVWCPGCKRPYSHIRWTCACNLQWHNCIKHRPIVAESTHSPGLDIQRKPDKAVSASSSAARLNAIEPHSASRVIMSARLAQGFPHLVGAPMDQYSLLPTECSQQSPTRIDNHTIHEESPQHVHEDFTAQPEDETLAPPAVASSSVVVEPAPNLG